MDAARWGGVGERLAGAPPEPWLVLLGAVAAVALVLPRASWRVTRAAVTLAHEGGHALVALLAGRRLEGIRLHSDTSGLTVSRGRPTGLGMVLTSAAGYTAPPLLGLAGAGLLAAGHVTALLWGATALLLGMLVVVRNAFGMLTVVLTAGAFLLVSWLADATVRAGFASGVVWFLLLGGVRPVWELQARRRRRRRAGRRARFRRHPAPYPADDGADSDADQLARLTGAPAGVWLLFFHTVALCSLLGGGRWLLGG